MSYFIAVFLLLILACLAAAGFFMLRSSKEKSMVWALTVRIGLSVLLFLLILVAWSLGWIQPSGIRLR